jgi:ketosteroid isomerase-like protein
MTVEDDRAELARLEVEWMQAMQDRDEPRLEELVGESFRFTAVHLGPDPMRRRDWMLAAMTGYSILSFHFSDMEVDVTGDTGVIHARYSQVASFRDTDLSNVFRLTDVWAREAGRWRVVVCHSSILS